MSQAIVSSDTGPFLTNISTTNLMLKQQILTTITRYKMLDHGDHVLVGISGGPDSTALLLALKELSKELKIKVYAASLDHMFRKTESQNDVLFAKKLAKKLKIRFFQSKVNVPELHKAQGGSKEDIARSVRYNFLLKAANKFSANKIALGHTKDDQAETVLMRLIYGAGITGLSGIPPTRKTGKYLIIRPLIETAKSDVVLYLKENNIKPRFDSSNIQDIYKRNKIRSKLIPFLEKEFNPNIKEALSRTASLLRDDRDLLEEVILKNIFENVIKPDKKNGVLLNLKKFDKLHVALRKYVTREAIRRVNTNLTGIEHRHWRLLEDFIAKRKNKASWHLPYGCRVMVKKGNLLFYNVS